MASRRLSARGWTAMAMPVFDVVFNEPYIYTVLRVLFYPKKV